MKQHWFNPQISLGTIIQIAAIAVAAVTYHNRTEARLARLEELVVREISRADDHDRQLRTLIQSNARITAILEEREVRRN